MLVPLAALVDQDLESLYRAEHHGLDLRELFGRARAARGEQLEVGRDEGLALLLVAAVDGEREQLAVGVGVDVARDADEVVDLGPPAAVVVGEDVLITGAGPIGILGTFLLRSRGLEVYTLARTPAPTPSPPP